MVTSGKLQRIGMTHLNLLSIQIMRGHQLKKNTKMRRLGEIKIEVMKRVIKTERHRENVLLGTKDLGQ